MLFRTSEASHPSDSTTQFKSDDTVDNTIPARLQSVHVAPPFDASTPFKTAPIPLGLKMPGPAPRSLAIRFTDSINAKDYFARGDGTGATPADEGVDITGETWNNWTLYPFFTDKAYSPYYANSQGTFQPPRPHPFENNDTWDSIGVNLALWNANGAGGVFIPAGVYSINVAECPIIMMKGMSSSIRGAGMYHTTLQTKEDSSFFANTAGQLAKYQVIWAYRPGGPPTYIEDMTILGCQNYGVNNKNLVGVKMTNTNGL